MQNHENFSKFLIPITFEHFINNYTNFSNNKTENFCENIKDDICIESNCKNENIIFKLSSALSNPSTINLISSLLLKEDMNKN